VRLATTADVRAYFGALPAQTMRAYVAEMGGEIVGIVGLVQERGGAALFADWREVLRPHFRSMAVMRAIRAVLGWVQASVVPVVAGAKEDEPLAPGLLERMGFRPVEVAGEVVYVYEPE
jgi:hypothetical protein